MTPSTAEDLTVVIPTLGRPVLRRCLESLASGSTLPGEVIVVDQGRVAAIEAMAREFDEAGLAMRYIPSERIGRSAGLNTGLEQVGTDFVAITDDDCVAAPDWVERLAAELRKRRRTIVTGRVEAGEGESVLSVVTSKVPDLQRRPRLRYDRLSGGNMGMPAALAREIGRFEEDPCMRTAEDAEFAYRALRAGVAIAYVPEIVVSHLGWRDHAQRDAQYRSYALSQGGFFGRYLRRGDLFIALRVLVHLARSLRRWLWGSLLGDRERARNGRAYVTGLLPGIAAGWKRVGSK
jgi:GT2 family glycosyltransferase